MKPRYTLLAAVLATLAACTPIEAREVAFEWDRNPEPEVNEYRVEVRDAVTNALLKSATVSDNPATPENDVPVTVSIPGYPLLATKVTAFAVVRVTEGTSLESLPSEVLPVEALIPGQVQALKRKLP